jgi:DNA repair photolyase
MLTINRKSLLYKSGVEYADFCLNHVEGCSHGCKFPCYAFMMKKRCGVVKSYNEWCNPKIVANALELLDYEIPKYKTDIDYVHLCFSTDPFMYNQTEVIELSLCILKKLNSEGIRCTLLTKGIYPSQIVSDEAFSIKNEYGITLISMDEKFREEFEPYTAPYEKRIEALHYLHDNSLKTWVSIEPFPPPNIQEQDIVDLLETVSFVDKIIFGRWNYNSIVSEYKLHREYYHEVSLKTIEFCDTHGIDNHIKEGTYTTN